jgi:hypothetical protein
MRFWGPSGGFCGPDYRLSSSQILLVEETFCTPAIFLLSLAQLPSVSLQLIGVRSKSEPCQVSQRSELIPL